MAITKAQQYKQMLRDGGVTEDIGFSIVKPSKDGSRPGYRRANYDASGGGLRDSSPGGKGPESRDRDNLREQASVASTLNKKIPTIEEVREIVQKGPDDRGTPTQNLNQQKIKEAAEKRIAEEKRRREEIEKRKQKQIDDYNKAQLAKIAKGRKFKNISDLKSLEQLALEDEEEDKDVKPGFFDKLKGSITNFTPPSISLLEGITDLIPGRKLSDMYVEYGDDYKNFDDYQRDVLAGKISTKGGPMGGFFRDGQGNLIGGRDGPDNQIIPQVVPTTTAPTTTATTSDEDVDDINRRLAIRFAGSEFDFADGGRVPAMGGGIMNTDVIGGFADGSMDQMGRQMYGLGKLVKKAVKGVKKIAKSPVGKAALLYFGGNALTGGGLKSFLLGSNAGPSFSKTGILKKMFLKNPSLGFSLGNISPVAGILGTSALAGLMTPKQEEDEEQYLGPSIDIPAIRRDPYAFIAPRFEGTQFAADGGRIGYDTAGAVMSEEDMKKLAKSPLYKGFKRMYGIDPQGARENKSYEGKLEQFEQLYKQGFQEGGKAEPVAKKTMPLIDMDGMEKDYRETGGFVEMGRMERADDVPARLSKNEFVFTADAVRNAGEGDIDKGAEVMYNMMKNLESGGEVSEESQGLEGARKMFQTSQRLGEVI
jgi:hypothetical protein